MRKKTYSKKRTETSSLVTQCFTTSSSPAKPGLPSSDITLPNAHHERDEGDLTNIAPLPDSPAKNTRGQRKQRALQSSPGDGANTSAGNDSIDILVEGLGSLSLTQKVNDNHVNTAKWSPDDKLVSSRPILQSKDANMETAKPPGRRIKKAIELDPNHGAAEVLPEFDSLAISSPRSPARKPEKEPTHVDEQLRGSTHEGVYANTRHDRQLRKKIEHHIQPDFSAYTQPLLTLCSDPVGRLAPTPFQAWADDLSQFFNITKIAEASYGEVYRLSLSSPKQGLGKSDESVLKLIALKPPPTPARSRGAKNSSKTDANVKETRKTLAMSSVADVTSEVRLLRHLSPVPGFTNFREIRVLQGRLPRQFVAAWKWYHKNVKKSLFLDPSKKASYDENQLWAVIEMQDAGTDVETLLENAGVEQKVSVWPIWDIFWSVACAVAKGEEWTGFEHRDLHLGNICVRSETSQGYSFLNQDAGLLNLGRTLGFTGLETTLIDYTLSRADMGNGQDVAFFDLSKDPAIFQGDGEIDYQYDIYRAMRSAVVHSDPTIGGSEYENEESNEALWNERHPLTNLIWLHFVLYKLMERLSDESYSYSEELTAMEKQLRDRLDTLSTALRLDSLAKSDLRSTADLVGWALDQGWLAEADVVGVSIDEEGWV